MRAAQRCKAVNGISSSIHSDSSGPWASRPLRSLTQQGHAFSWRGAACQKRRLIGVDGAYRGPLVEWVAQHRRFLLRVPLRSEGCTGAVDLVRAHQARLEVLLGGPLPVSLVEESEEGL